MRCDISGGSRFARLDATQRRGSTLDRNIGLRGGSVATHLAKVRGGRQRNFRDFGGNVTRRRAIAVEV